MSSQTTIQNRIKKDQELIIEQLKRTPIVQAAVEKVGIARSTFYRWKKENFEFNNLADEALAEGIRLMNDFAESQLLSAIREKNMTGIIFWLRSHHSSYATKVEVDARLKMDKEILTPEQEDLVEKALKLAGLLTAGQERKGEENEP